jgi:CRISPR-associated protein Csd1
MLLQRLVDRTQTGEAAEPAFFRDRAVRWQLALSAGGGLASAELTDLADPSDRARKNGSIHPVPHTTRTVGVAPCIGADDIQYVLGWCDEKSKAARVEQCHAALHQEEDWYIAQCLEVGRRTWRHHTPRAVPARATRSTRR